MRHTLCSAMLLFVLSGTCLSAESGGWHRYTVGDGLTTDEVRQIVELPNGQVLVNTEGAFALFDGRSFRELPCDQSRVCRLSSFEGYAHRWQGDSLLWLRDFYHLYLFDARTRTFRYDMESHVKGNSLEHFAEQLESDVPDDGVWHQHMDSICPRAKVEAKMTDRQGGLWVGTRSDGLFYFRPARHTAANVGHNDSLLHAVRFTMDRQGRAWQCTGDGLYCRPQTDLLMPADKAVRYGQDNVEGFIHNRMIFVTPLPDGRLLLCNHMHYLGYFYPEEHRFEALNPRLPALEKYRMDVGAVVLPRTDEVLVYSQNGAFVLDTRRDTVKAFAPANEIARWTEKYNCALVDSRGRLWLGTQKGLFLTEREEGRGKREEGSGEAWSQPVRIDGLANNCIRSLVEDGAGNVWVGTSANISRVTPDLDVMNLGLADAVPEMSMAERAAALLDDGRLVFVQHTMGLTVFRPEWFEPDTVRLSVRLVGFEMNGTASPTPPPLLGMGAGGRQREGRGKREGESFPYNHNYLTFRFSALNYAAPEHTRYRYRLVGLDREWLHDNSGQGLATVVYNALPPGRYVFEAQAATDGGEWGELLQVPFTIRPPWWLTWWMKAIYILLGFVSLMGLINYYLKKKRSRLEAEAEARVNRLFELREQARHQFVENVRIDASKISVNSEEETFVQQVLKAIEANLDNTEYSVDQLARDVCYGRSNLYKQMQTMLGITPNDFIRSIRLKRAAVLLADTELSIVEISERVGFSTPRYFSASFKKMFGVTPTEYREPTRPAAVGD